MKRYGKLPLRAAVLFMVSTSACFGYDQVATNVYAPAANGIEKSATAAPNDLATFTNAMRSAFLTNCGGVFDLPATIPANTTIYRATYGTKRLQVTSSAIMQDVGTSGSFTPVSGSHATTSAGDITGYNLAFSPSTDTNTGQVLPEAAVRVALTILSRTHATYPCDVRATVFFNDGSTQTAISVIGNLKASDDTFYSFAAPSGLYITNLFLESFATGTTTPVATRICFDDLGFITGPTVPPPQIAYLSPFNYAIARAQDGIAFQVLSYVDTAISGISLVLNSNDVSSQLVITGPPTNRAVSLSGLGANQTYTMQITASNAAGVATLVSTFYTGTGMFTLFDSGGFSDTALYPVGSSLQASTNAGCVWVPPADAAQIVDSGDPQHGPVLQEMQMGNDQSTYLQVPPIASGVVRMSFDALVSTPFSRTLDFGLNTASGGLQSSFVAWGVVTNEFGTNSGQFAYFNGSSWIGVVGMDTGWHHYENTNPSAVPPQTRLMWWWTGSEWRTGNVPGRTAAADSLGGGATGGHASIALDYAQVDNLLVQAGPEISGVAPPPRSSMSPDRICRGQARGRDPLPGALVT